MKLKIGVVSDFHCHNKENNKGVRESHILTDEVFPDLQNPFESLKLLIKEDPNIVADILMMPGDFANQSDLEGLALGWEMTKEMGTLFQAIKIIPNIGNHDVDSRHKLGENAFEHVMSLADDFPFQDSDANAFFWEHGFLILEEPEYRILVINSVHSHVDKASADHGLISQEAINEIEKTFKGNSDTKLNIAMVHHNPIEHSHFNTGSKDFMYNGDELISILDLYNFDLIIHGHKHDPRIRYAQGGGNSPVIFSSGSFCAFNGLLLQGAHNTFHIITMEVDPSKVGRGIIETWFFVPSKGWKKEVISPYFHARIGFGAVVDLKGLALSIIQWFQDNGKKYVEWEELVKDFPDLMYIIPSDLEKLKGYLKLGKVSVSPMIINEPIFVHYKSK